MMDFWSLFEDGAWVLSALIAGWLLYDAFRVGRDYDEEFLVHTIEDFGEDADWQQEAGNSNDMERPQS
jgi:hypothetical protein